MYMLAHQVTSRIQLAVPRPALDGPDLFALLAKEPDYYARYLPWVAQTTTAADEVAFLQQTNRHLGQGTSLNLVILVAGVTAGMISCNRFDQLNQSADIGYWLGRAYQGQGIMTTAVKGLCDLVFSDYAVNRLVIRAAVENTASNAVAQRAGFQPEGILRQNEKLADGFHDEQQYSYLKTDWLAAKGL
ncbi:MAG TPA: GNAT family N-acetyltransferase [Candidatus Levilactobacillus faecigallinarum]|uniref:GNAT family N-acetyltransferase n=1 Tax=Candidatus Levilactobacillus faecigallinarum TaxID=2838638 RepID=A0A9D1QRW8_9LACO|nr:GNAT family N-acetyltransferase [Candidatus Levilactobacillus faecigallinarum]